MKSNQAGFLILLICSFLMVCSVYADDEATAVAPAAAESPLGQFKGAQGGEPSQCSMVSQSGGTDVAGGATADATDGSASQVN